ncbi:Low-density lipoprotein receptor-related protein 1 [Armadillidium vulgare]|nr:Low-density lipoprotein receptor-related protein 1 [Armadillidium vulgare]
MEDPDKRRILVSGKLGNVRAIVLDPGSGIMFWSIWEFTSSSYGKTGLIETAWMDGTNRRPFVEKNLYWPNGLTIDYDGRHLYWCDGYYLKIERINLDGTERKVILEGDPLVHPYGLSYFKGFIYWSEYQNGTIMRANLNNTRDIQILQKENPKVFDIKVFSKERQQGSNGCDKLNCEDLCFATPEGPKCDCRMGYEPSVEDKTSCIPTPNFTLPKICEDDQFLCNKSLYCIERNFVCDGENDCHDFSDEILSPWKQVECHEHVKCKNNKCISSLWVCDGDMDCNEGSDELDENCQCSHGQFKCKSGRCISQSWVCDTEEDCGPGDRSDEHENCDYFTCGDKSCIPIFFVCDNEEDCEDGTDEMFCNDFCLNATMAGHQMSPYCNQNCKNITNATLCEAVETCHLCSDETENVTCIPSVQICDMNKDCPSGSDEKACPASEIDQCEGKFLCSTLKPFVQCLPKSLRCDGNYDCLDRSDEEGCDNDTKCSFKMFKCSSNGDCIHGFYRCDGEIDCEDGSDEDDCPSAKTPCPLPSIKCDNDSKCVPPDMICNNYSDCKDGSDEGNRCGANDCDLLVCEESCRQGPEGPFCVCPEGEKLLEDGTSCSKVNECDEWGKCSQICTPLKHSYVCSCFEGYQLELDRYTCKSTDPAIPYLIFSNRHELRRISLKPGSSFDKALISSLKNTIALDFYYGPQNEFIFWTDVVDEKIYKGEMVSGALTNIEVVVQTGLSTAEGLAVDWVGNNLYWVESNLDQIEVAKLNGSFRRTLISSNMESPRAISLDPRVGMLFWTDWEILRSHKRLSHAFAISLFENTVYWTDWRTNSVTSANKFNGTDIQILQVTITQPFDIHILHPSRQPKVPVNPCEKDNGGCSHLCLLSFNSTRQCNCPQIMSLSSDNVTCVRKEKVLVFSRSNEIRGVDISKPSSDIITRIPILKSQTSLPIDFVENNRMIYWADTRLNEIRRINISTSGSPKETVVDTAIESPNGFAIDWLSGNMFIGSSGPTRKQISVGTINGEFVMPIITESIYQIESLAVDPYEGRIFWSDVGETVHTIQVSSMLGTNRKTISSQKDNQDLKYPTSLSFDPQSKRLYWANKGSKTIQYFDFSENKLHTLLTGGNKSEPIAITVYKEFVYYYDAFNNNIYRMDKYAGKGRETIQTNVNGILSLKIYDKNLRMGSSNACSQDYQRCAHLCLPLNATERKCMCAVGYRVDENDPNVCVGENDILIYSTPLGLSGISVADLTIEDDYSNNDEDTGLTLDFNSDKNYLPPISQVGDASRLDFHVSKDLLIFVNEKSGTITRIQRDGTDRRTLFKDSESVEGIAVDWVSNNVYWSNVYAKVIELCKLKGSERFVVIAEGLSKPGALAVYPSKGLLFWADVGKIPRIGRSTLNGKDIKILANSSLQYPNDLSIDYTDDVLYFIDRDLKTLEKMNIDGSSRTPILNFDSKPSSVFVFEDYIYVALSDKSSGSLHVIHKQTLKKKVLRSESSSLKSLIIMSNNAQSGTNPCADENGGCSELCLFNGTAILCECFHGTIGSDGRTCQDYDAFLMYSNNTSIESLHMFDDGNPNLPLKSITSDFIKNAISLAFDYRNKRLYYSDIQRRSINSVFFNGTDHVILVEGQGSVEGVAFEESHRDLYWTCQNDASINRMSVLPEGSQVEKFIHLRPDDKPRGIAVYSCERQVFWTNWNSKAPSLQKAYVSGMNVQSIITTHIRMPNGLVIDHKALKLYWGDARLDKIERCNLDGTGRIVLIKDYPNHPFDLAVYGDFLFWTDWGLQAVVRANKYTGKEITKLTPKIPNLMGIIAVANDTNVCVASPCRVVNGGCEDFCHLDERGQVFCTCLHGRILLPDGRRCGTKPSNCTDEEFTCGSGFCIPYTFSCDGVPECPDGSDENSNYCSNRICRDGHFSCGKGLCILKSKHCDGVLDCPGFEDEIDCECKPDEFRCAESGICLSESLRCNFEPDCHDASDEMGCGKTNCSTLLKDQYKGVELINCANTSNCIHPKWICDGVNDCWDNSDEIGCNTINGSCSNGKFLCDLTHCLPSEWLCDLEIDCNDRSDEINCSTTTSTNCKGTHYECVGKNCTPKVFVCDEDNDIKKDNSTKDEKSYQCPKGQFKCESDGKCIYDHWRCDGMKDCRDGSDEPDDCRTLTCSSKEFKCNGTGRCIPLTWVCDGDIDCGEGADDENPKDGCPSPKGGAAVTHSEGACEEGQFMCRMFHHAEYECIPMDFYCDAIVDCTDGSDEPETCHKRECFDSQFTCANKKCIPHVWVCNGRDDCSDASDENNCMRFSSVEMILVVNLLYKLFRKEKMLQASFLPSSRFTDAKPLVF